MFPALTPTLLPATHTNSYAIGGRDVVLVEPATPYEDEQREWLAWARGLVSAGRKLVAIFATHHHPDHVGGLDVLARELDVPVWAHPETFARVPQQPNTKVWNDGERFVLEGPRDEQWCILHTPGHAPGHLCLLEERSRTLIVGDMVASVGTILIAPGDGVMKTYLEQLERLATLDASVALPAHGDPIDAPTELFRKYVAHRLMREAKVLDAVRGRAGEAATAEDLVPIAYADTPARLWPIARLSLLAHLEKLVTDGKVVAEPAADTFRVV